MRTLSPSRLAAISQAALFAARFGETASEPCQCDAGTIGAWERRWTVDRPNIDAVKLPRMRLKVQLSHDGREKSIISWSMSVYHLLTFLTLGLRVSTTVMLLFGGLGGRSS